MTVWQRADRDSVISQQVPKLGSHCFHFAEIDCSSSSTPAEKEFGHGGPASKGIEGFAIFIGIIGLVGLIVILFCY